MRTPALIALLALAACGQDQPRGDPLKGGAPSGAPAPTVQPSTPPGHPTIPTDHPPMDGPVVKAPPLGAAPTKPAPTPTPPTAPAAGSAAIEWTAPEGWATTPGSGMRLATLSVAPQVDCIVFHGMRGGVDANFDRWAGQMGKAPADVKRTKLEIPGLEVVACEIAGEFSGGMTPSGGQGGAVSGAMLLGAWITGSPTSGDFCLKLVGPAAVVEANRAKFDALVRSLKPAGGAGK